jgi:hypothetical protein
VVTLTVAAVEKQYYIFLCVCVCVCVCVCGCAGVCVHACSHTSPAGNAPPYCHLRPLWLHHIFRHYLLNGTVFGKRLQKIKCVFWFSTQLLFEKFLIRRRIQRDIVINVKTSSLKVPIILVRFEWNLNFLVRRSRKVQISSFITLRPVGAALFHADGQTMYRRQRCLLLEIRSATVKHYHLLGCYAVVSGRYWLMLRSNVLFISSG